VPDDARLTISGRWASTRNAGDLFDPLAKDMNFPMISPSKALNLLNDA
jgi:hypothetical protein